jgi:large subunit ribosomal protein L9
MEVILLKDIDKLGDKHSIVSVKPGYGRNFLIPKGVGVVANSANKKKLETLIADEEAKEAARLEDYKVIAAQLEGQTLKIGVKAGTSGKIFGSVTSVQISQALKDQLNLDIVRKKIILPEDIKEVGSYEATINLHKEVTSKVAFELIAE